MLIKLFSLSLCYKRAIMDEDKSFKLILENKTKKKKGLQQLI